MNTKGWCSAAIAGGVLTLVTVVASVAPSVVFSGALSGGNFQVHDAES